MGIFFSLLVMLFPIAEIWTLIRVGSRIGFWDTLFLLILSGFFGAYLAKVQGQVVIQRIQKCLAEGKMPTLEMLDGVLVFIGGLLFIFPGFISDVLGLLLIFPLTRWLIRMFLLQGIRSNLQMRPSSSTRSGTASGSPQKPVRRGDVSDAEIVD